MSAQDQVQGLLAKLDKSLNKRKGNKDWKAINEARKKAFWKPKDGQNKVAVFTPAFAEDPFTTWGFHNNLQEVSYYSVPCDAYNKAEDCLICNVVNSLKKENFEGNKHLWLPIEQKVEYYVPMVSVESAATIAEGPKWFRVSKTILNQMIDSLKNLEDGELPFYSPEGLQRIIINYGKNQAPATQYSVQFKDMKDRPSVDQIAEWAGAVTPVGEYILSKSEEEIKKIVDEYFARIADAVDESIDKGDDSDPLPEPEETPATSKLASLKK